MLELENLTGFPTQNYMAIDQLDRGYDVIVARISYDFEIDLMGRAELKFATVQSPVCMADEYYGDPKKTSVIIECDLSPYKPFLDVVVNGVAYAPLDKPSKRFGVSVTVGDKQKVVAVTGSRCWQKQSLGWSLGEPIAITELPLKYEYAFGGFHQVDEEPFASSYNNIGIGWYPPEYLRKLSTSNILSAPQIMNPDRPVEDISKPVRAEGFGFYGRSWKDRLQYSGTADKKWQEERHPLLPLDFDMHYWNGAHPDLQFRHPKPNHIYDIQILGMVRAQDVPKQNFLLHIPVETLFAFVKTQQNIGLSLDLSLDTVVVSVEERKIYCSYRLCLAEELTVDKAQLRFIARHERGQQIELAREIVAQKSDLFVPVPPSLMTVEQKTSKQ